MYNDYEKKFLWGETMNSQFKNSNLGFVIYAALIAIIAAATFFMLWYMIWGYKVGTYGPDTRLGSVYIGGLREDQVFSRIDEKVDAWYADEHIKFEVNYQDYTYELDRSYILFNLEMSNYTITDGVTNELYVSIQYQDQESIKSDILELPYLQNIKDDVDLQGVINMLLNDAALMKSYSAVDLEDYLDEEGNTETIINSTTFTLPQGVEIEELTDVINELYPDGKILIPEKDVFDVLEVFGDDYSDIHMNVLSTAMLANIQETNFIINEVHYNPTIDFGRYTVEDYPYYGRNTVVNEIIDQSFSFYNPNEYDYYFMITDNNDGTYQLDLVGLAFEYTIDVTVNKTMLDYITQTTKDVELLQDGHEGVIVEVVRTISDVYGNVISEEQIIYEFYPPVKQIDYDLDE